MQIETGVVITALTGIIGLSAWTGTLWQRVNGHDKDIEDKAKAVELFRSENREDHRQLFCKLDELNKYVRNGKKDG